MKTRSRYPRGFALLSASGAVAVGLLMLPPIAAPATWSLEKNVEIIVPTGPGGGNDRAGRTVQRLLKDLRLVNVTTSLVNKPGAGGVLGWTYLNQHPGDAHYLSTSTPALLTTHITGRSEATYTDITPIAQLYTESSVFLVKTGSSIWDGAFAALARSEEWKNYLKENGLEDAYMNSEASARFLDAQYKAYKEALTNLGLAKAGASK